MSCNAQRARLLIKRSSGKPTIPTSPDHTDGTWLVTDIYVGEQYMDTDTGIIYTRTLDDDIVVVSDNNVGQAESVISQTGTAAITLDNVFVNTLSVTSNVRIDVGEYRIGLGSIYSGGTVQITNGIGDGFVTAYFNGTDDIFIYSYDAAGVASDDIIKNASMSVKLYNSIIS